MTWKAFVRATRPTFLRDSPKNNHCTRNVIVLADSFTLEELNRTMEIRTSERFHPNRKKYKPYRTVEGRLKNKRSVYPLNNPIAYVYCNGTCWQEN